ncbi:UPF0678 fatty acid-binding protein-like protein [Trichoplax sp. H2]|nr:UPF0678 fatty acid-binding protein-like protein [Trichoplax sp. H2]|eukprot:RDD39237.1 UPF0678 fatty acid-binding protein-like protein [Trichoplax sp. H2]
MRFHALSTAITGGRFSRKFLQALLFSSQSNMADKCHLHESLQDVSWLLGTWSGQGDGIYPNIKSFSYKEEIKFSHVGQPNLQFQSSSWHLTNNTPMHFESGFWFFDRNHVKAAIAHNLGVCDIMEGEMTNNQITVTTTDITRKSDSKPPKVTKVQKIYKLLEDGDLEYIMLMETEQYPLQEHLRSRFKKQ